MRFRSTLVLFALATGAFAFLACVSDEGSTAVVSSDAGAAGEPCFANGTCLDTLTCISNVCVALGQDGATADAPKSDASKNDATITDGSTTKDASSGADVVVSTCAVNPGSGFAKKLGTTTKMTGACTTAQLQGFATACYTPGATGSSCNMWATTNGGCAVCMISQQSDANWGAFVNYPFEGATLLEPNKAGCEQLVTGDLNCAKAMQDGFDCQAAACSSCSASDMGACLKAQESTCTALPPCAASMDANDPCAVGGSMDGQAFAMYYGMLFCGP